MYVFLRIMYAVVIIVCLISAVSGIGYTDISTGETGQYVQFYAGIGFLIVALILILVGVKIFRDDD